MNKSRVFEISEMEFTEDTDDFHNDAEEMDIETAIDIFNKVFNKSIYEWSQYEEEEFITKVRKVTGSVCDLQMIDRVVDSTIALSYQRQIDNFKDYLFILCAKNIFPEGMVKYETLQPVIEEMFDEATYRIDKMDYRAKDIQELTISLWSLNMYYDQLPISMEEAADKVFSSIGIRYSTVEHILGEYNE